MKAIVVSDEAAGTAGMTLTERPEPEPASNDVLVEVHASGFTPGELSWSTTIPLTMSLSSIRIFPDTNITESTRTTRSINHCLTG